MKKMVLSGLLVAIIGVATAQTVTLLPVRDNTLFSNDNSLSSGAGDHLYTGRTIGNGPRRSLLAFDLSSIPANATITEVSLTLTVTKAKGDPITGRLHRLTQAWGEGTSAASAGNGAAATPGDATWAFAFFDSLSWQNPGGDFIAEASGTTTVPNGGSFTFNSAQMAADVQIWADSAALNHGWVLIGDETVTGAAKQMEARESADADARPRLEVTYEVSTSLTSHPLAEVQVFPNPAQEQVRVSLPPTARDATLTLSNALGQALRSTTAAQPTFAVADLPAGVYFVKVRSAAGQTVRRVLLTR